MGVLLQLHDISKRYGVNHILEDASASFSEDQKIAFIGRNGAGKSTLCKIIIGQEKMDSGEITRNSALRLSYLEQHDPFQPGETVLQFLMRYTGKEEWECAELAAKFQLRNELLDTQISSLPGGYQTRVKLTAMLLNAPNFLILDEPTNYLDLSTLILLENFLKNFNGGFLIVSHDREFLKRTCDHTLEIERGQLTLYPGSIEEYFEFKEVQLHHKMSHNKTVEKKKEQLQEFIDRFRAKASTASRAKSKMKQLDRLKTIQIEHPMSRVKIRIPKVENKAGIALKCDDLTIGYPERTIANKINFVIDRGLHVAIVGDNGQGKTTFLKTLAGELKAKDGHFKWGSGLKIAYYAQHVLTMLHPQDDIVAHLSRMAGTGVTNEEILSIAGCFLFKGDDVRKKISVLSGGEKARLALAGLLLTRSHVLLLDEPTNHLDFETVEALGRALKEFEGTLFFISHDRTFVNLIASSVIGIKNGSVSRYPGTYEDYVYHLELEAQNEMGIPSTGEQPKGHHKETSHSEEKKPVAEDTKNRKQANSEAVKIKSDMIKTERRMGHNTQERDTILSEMKKNPLHFSRKRNDRLKELTILIEDDEKEWLLLQERLETVSPKK